MKLFLLPVAVFIWLAVSLVVVSEKSTKNLPADSSTNTQAALQNQDETPKELPTSETSSSPSSPSSQEDGEISASQQSEKETVAIETSKIQATGDANKDETLRDSNVGAGSHGNAEQDLQKSTDTAGNGLQLEELGDKGETMTLQAGGSGAGIRTKVDVARESGEGQSSQEVVQAEVTKDSESERKVEGDAPKDLVNEDVGAPATPNTKATGKTPDKSSQTQENLQQQNQQEEQQKQPPPKQQVDVPDAVPAAATDDGRPKVAEVGSTQAGPGESQPATETTTTKPMEDQQQRPPSAQTPDSTATPPEPAPPTDDAPGNQDTPEPGPAATGTQEQDKDKEETEEDEEEDIKVPDESAEDKLPSFDEWKQKMLAEQAEQEKSKTVDVQSTQTAPAAPVKSKGTKKVNYASATCGAKVRAANGEAQSASFVLSENKDQYIINPCKAKKWFVVELCTPVQIQALEIGNLELFSSQPESFVAHISEGYPTKDWKPLGTFHARDERSVQSFSVADEQMYAHYIKVEMLSHYGSEHYCPLTVLRVYGLTVTEADDDVEDHDTTDDDVDILEDSGKESTLFNSAKETVIGLVKTVLSQGDEEDEAATPEKPDQNDATTGQNSAGTEGLQDVIKLQGANANKTNQNASAQEAPAEPGQPCTPDVSTPSGDDAAEGNTDNKGCMPKTPNNIVDKEPQQGIVTLIETPSISLMSLLVDCSFCSGKPVCYVDRQTTCGYYRLWKFVYPTSCKDHKQERNIKDSPKVSKEPTLPDPKVSSIPLKDTKTVNSIEPSLSQRVLTSLQETTQFSDELEASVSATLSSLRTPTISVANDVVQGSTVIQESANEKVESTPALNVDVTETSTSDVIIETKILETATETKEPLKTDTKCDISDPTCQRGPDPMQIRPTATTKEPDETPSATATETAKPMTDNLPTPDATPSDPEASTDPDESLEDPEDLPAETNGLKNIYAEDPATADTDSTPDLPPPAQTVDDTQYQKLISGRKETTFMKLKNRIKALELNLNLSSQYLEELSQRYRRHMEDMYSSLNKTITKLANTSRKAEDRDMKQQDHIRLLQEQISRLNDSLDTMRDGMTEVNMQLIERHLYLMLIEAVVFLSMLAWCLHRQERSLHHGAPPRYHGDVRTPDKVQSVWDSPSGLRRRRYSTEGVTPSRDRAVSAAALVTKRRAYDDSDIKKAESESGLGRLAPLDDLQRQWEMPKKKKKKKAASSQKSLQFGSLVGTSLNSKPSGASTSLSSSCSTFSNSSRGGANTKRTNSKPEGGVDQSKSGKSYHRKTPSLDSNHLVNGAPLENGHRGTCNGHVEDVERKWNKHSGNG